MSLLYDEAKKLIENFKEENKKLRQRFDDLAENCDLKGEIADSMYIKEVSANNIINLLESVLAGAHVGDDDFKRVMATDYGFAAKLHEKLGDLEFDRFVEGFCKMIEDADELPNLRSNPKLAERFLQAVNKLEMALAGL